jgi:2-oxoglutarate dehydrogenase E2 component (dihydrolipoamide succinyltransferase)
MSTATTLLPIRVPSVGESITSGVLGSWKKKNGDAVSSGEALFEIETDKVTSEVFAEADGTIEILVPEGTEVKVGQTVGNLHPGKAPSRKSTPPEIPKREKAELTPLPKTPARETPPPPSPDTHTHTRTCTRTHILHILKKEKKTCRLVSRKNEK